MASTTVKDVMTSGPTSIASDAMVVEAARRMLSEDVGSLPVVDGDQVVGMITDRDVVLQVVAKDLDANKVPVSTVCSESPVTAEADESLDDALAKMAKSRSADFRRERRPPSSASSPRRTSPGPRGPSRPAGSSRRSRSRRRDAGRASSSAPCATRPPGGA